MGISVVMPALEMAQETGKLVAWLKQEGEQVRKGEMLLEVETDKAVVEIEATGDGILGGVTAKPGDVIQVGHTIAWLLQPGESPPVATAAAASARTISSPSPLVSQVAAGPAPGGGGGPRLSPKARKLAQEHGVDIASLKGSGPGGEILADDILAATKVRLKPDTTTVRLKPDTTTVPPDSSVVSGFSRTSTASRLMAERTT